MFFFFDLLVWKETLFAFFLWMCRQIECIAHAFSGNLVWPLIYNEIPCIVKVHFVFWHCCMIYISSFLQKSQYFNYTFVVYLIFSKAISLSYFSSLCFSLIFSLDSGAKCLVNNIVWCTNYFFFILHLVEFNTTPCT